MIQHRYVVALAILVSFMINMGYLYGIGRMLPVIIDTFHTTRARASVIQASFSAMVWCLGVVSGIATQKFGARAMGVIGSSAAAVAVTLSYFATSIPVLVLTTGVVTGIGTSMIIMSGIAIIGNSFEGQSLQLVLSVVVASCGVGGMGYSYLLEYLLEEYGLRGTFLITGGILMNSIPLTICWPSRPSVRKREDSSQSETHTESASEMSVNEKQPPGDEHDSNKQNDIIHTIKQLFAAKSFLMFALGSGITLTSQATFLIFITDVWADRDFDPTSASLGLLLYNLASILGRLLPGILKQIEHCPSMTSPLLATVVGVVGCLLIVTMDDEVVSLLACCASGFSFGIVGSAIGTVPASLVSQANLSPCFGVSLTLSGIGIIVSGPINGYIRDVTESYTSVFLSSAVATLAGGVFYMATVVMEMRKRADKI